MDSREAPLFVVLQGWRTVCYCPLERRGRHSANPYGFDAAGIARLGACRELLRTSRSNPAPRRMLLPSLESPLLISAYPMSLSGPPIRRALLFRGFPWKLGERVAIISSPS